MYVRMYTPNILSPDQQIDLPLYDFPTLAAIRVLLRDILAFGAKVVDNLISHILQDVMAWTRLLEHFTNLPAVNYSCGAIDIGIMYSARSDDALKIILNTVPRAYSMNEAIVVHRDQSEV